MVSGFLGAGKTTFIQELARRTGRDFVVYENEYGQADIDAKVLSETDELSVWESTENCICCTGKQDFATSVLTIANTLDPEYLVVEPTGVARLSSILDNIDQVSYERISLLAPLAIVDATAWVRQRGRFEEIYLDQVRTANTVVVSKAQLAGTGELAELAAWVQGVSPDARLVDGPWDELSDAWFSGLLEDDLAGGGAGPSAAGDARGAAGSPVRARASAGRRLAGAPSAADDGFDSLSLSDLSLPSESHLLWFLDALVAGVFGEVVRAKGYLPCGGQWLRFDVVDRMWQVTGYEPGGGGAGSEPTAVLIGPSIRRPWLREVLVPLVRDASAYRNQSPRFEISARQHL